MKKLILSIILVAVLLLTVCPFAVQAQPDRPDRSSAANIELVKKITLKGPQAKGGKPSAYAATGTVGAPLPNGGKRYAIVIGINDYPGSSYDLQYCVADAGLVADVLMDIYNFDSVKKITDTAATYDNIQDEVAELAGTAGPKDEVVFFFSGHGAKGKVNDGDRSNVDQSIVVWDSGSWGYIWDGNLKDWFSGFEANRIIFIFDSCLSGGMSVLNAPGRIVNMACSANGVSYEGDWGGGHGQFTYYFAEEGMLYGSADVRADDGVVTDEEAFDYAKANCQFQAPVIADGFTDDLLP
jgi:hypothetical protein